MTVLTQSNQLPTQSTDSPELDAIIAQLTSNMPITHNAIIMPTDAEALLREMRAHKIQRKLDRDHVNRLRRGHLMKSSLRGTTLYIAHWKDATGTDCQCLIDGQHRMECVATNQKPELFIVVHEYFQTKAQVRARFNYFDKGKQRGKAAMIESFELDAEIGLTQNDLTKVYAGVRLINVGMDRWREREMAMDHDTMVPTIRHWQAEAVSYFGLIKGTKYGKDMTGGPMIAVMLPWLRANFDQAKDFIIRVACGKDGDSTPTRALINLLTKQNISAEVLKQSQRNTNKCRLIAQCVNAFQRSNYMDKVLPLTAKEQSDPILIMGTQYDGAHLTIVNEERAPEYVSTTYAPRKPAGKK
jgi:hypothetical protein